MTSIFTIYSELCKLSAPAHWRVRRFKDVITSSRSGIWGDDEKGNSDDIVCYRVADFDYSNLCLKFDNITYRNVLREQVDEKSLSAGDLLLEKSGGGEKMPVGRVVLVNSSQRAVCSNFIQALSVNKEYSARFVLYLFYSIYSNRINTLFFNQTTGIQNLKTSHYLAQEIILPPYPEQEAIAAYLDKECDKIRRKIELLERKADAYSRLRRSLINRAVTRGLDPNVSLKPSGNNWIGDIPQHWTIKRNKNILIERKDIVGENHSFKLLSLTLNGVIIRDLDAGGKFPAEFSSYKIVSPNNLIFCLFDVDETPRTIGLSSHSGMITGAYDIFDVNTLIAIPQWVYYFYFAIDQRKALKPFYTGLRKVVKAQKFADIHIPIPSIKEQKTIVAYLDEKCAKIDAIVGKINNQIERLKELKRSLINEVVTGKRAINRDRYALD